MLFHQAISCWHCGHIPEACSPTSVMPIPSRFMFVLCTRLCTRNDLLTWRPSLMAFLARLRKPCAKNVLMKEKAMPTRVNHLETSLGCKQGIAQIATAVRNACPVQLMYVGNVAGCYCHCCCADERCITRLWWCRDELLASYDQGLAAEQ